MYIYGLSVEGATSLSGRRWVRVSFKGQKAHLPHQQLAGSSNGALAALGRAGVIMSGPDAAKGLASKIMQLDDFPPKPLADWPGWNGQHFALPDGTVVSPAGHRQAKAVFEIAVGKCSSAGTIDGWKAGVAAPLMGQPLPMFAIMFALMPPLLELSDHPLNPCFELVGPTGTGKTLLQNLAASALGSVSYPVALNQALRQAEGERAKHEDLPMILRGAALLFAGESQSARASLFKQFIWSLVDRQSDLNSNSGLPALGRSGFLILSARPLADLVGDRQLRQEAQDRVVTLEVEAKRALGIFEHVPKGFPSLSHFLRALSGALAENHGQAIRHFLGKLVQNRAENEAALRSRIASMVGLFRTKAGVNLNDGSAVRTADAFGLVFAAGKLAREYGVLPDDWECGPTVLACYQRYFRKDVPERSFPDRLAEIADSESVVHLRPGEASVSLAEIEAGTKFVRHRSTRRELVVRPQHIQDVFSDWSAVSREEAVKALLIRDGRHLTTKRKLAKDLPAEPVFCFVLT